MDSYEQQKIPTVILAMNRVQAQADIRQRYLYYLNGNEYKEFILQLKKNWSTQKDEIKEQLESVRTKVLN